MGALRNALRERRRAGISDREDPWGVLRARGKLLARRGKHELQRKDGHHAPFAKR